MAILSSFDCRAETICKQTAVEFALVGDSLPSLSKGVHHDFQAQGLTETICATTFWPRFIFC